MTVMAFTQLVETEAWESVPLGTAVVTSGVGVGQYTSKDVGRAVKLGTTQNFVECVSGDDIDGFIMALQPYTVGSGFSFGSIKREGRVTAKAGGVIAYGAYVVAGTSPTTGTVETPANVISGVPTHCFWRYISNQTNTNPSAAAAIGDTILLERI